MTSQPPPDSDAPKSRLATLAADLQRLDASIDMDGIILRSILRTYPDGPETAALAGACAAIEAKARLRGRIEHSSARRLELLGDIAYAEALLPVVAKPMKTIRLRGT